jgi:alpha-mannosidase
MGTHTFTYSVYPHAGSWQTGGTYQQAYELNYPLLSQIGIASEEQTSQPNMMPESYSFVTTDRPNIMVSAVKKAEDDDEFIMRFYETWGKETDVEFEFGKQLVSTGETDLLERPENSLTPAGNKLTVHVKPFEIITLALRFAE